MRNLITAVASVAFAAGASADIVDLSGSTSDGLLGDASNTVVEVDLDAGDGALVAGFAFALSFEAFSPSWGSEARIQITSPDGTVVLLDGGDDFGWATSPGLFLAGGALTDFDGESFNGTWKFVFHEDFNDGVAPDGLYEAAIFIIKPVPAPGALALLGVAGLMGSRRRRRA